MPANHQIKPILKWVGGKRQLLPELLPLIPDFDNYCEPFIGGAAMLLSLQPKSATINDYNAELMNVYRVIRDDVEALITDLKKHENTPEYFYEMRGKDRDKRVYSHLSPMKRASRVIYLNKTCFNGLYRVNAAGQLNAPFGAYKNPNIVNEEGLRAVSTYLRSANVTILQGDYAAALENLPEGTFVYLDPPYDPISETAAFTGYTQGGFSRLDQIKLREACDTLNERGIKFMLSNSATDFIKDQYSEYHIQIIKAKRAINCKGSRRGTVDEVVVTNYG